MLYQRHYNILAGACQEKLATGAICRYNSGNMTKEAEICRLCFPKKTTSAGRPGIPRRASGCSFTGEGLRSGDSPGAASPAGKNTAPPAAPWTGPLPGIPGHLVYPGALRDVHSLGVVRHPRPGRMGPVDRAYPQRGVRPTDAGVPSQALRYGRVDGRGKGGGNEVCGYDGQASRRLLSL